MRQTLKRHWAAVLLLAGAPSAGFAAPLPSDTEWLQTPAVGYGQTLHMHMDFDPLATSSLGAANGLALSMGAIDSACAFGKFSFFVGSALLAEFVRPGCSIQVTFVPEGTVAPQALQVHAGLLTAALRGQFPATFTYKPEFRRTDVWMSWTGWGPHAVTVLPSGGLEEIWPGPSLRMAVTDAAQVPEPWAAGLSLCALGIAGLHSRRRRPLADRLQRAPCRAKPASRTRAGPR